MIDADLLHKIERLEQHTRGPREPHIVLVDAGEEEPGAFARLSTGRCVEILSECEFSLPLPLALLDYQQYPPWAGRHSQLRSQCHCHSLGGLKPSPSGDGFSTRAAD